MEAGVDTEQMSYLSVVDPVSYYRYWRLSYSTNDGGIATFVCFSGAHWDTNDSCSPTCLINISIYISIFSDTFTQ